MTAALYTEFTLFCMVILAAIAYKMQRSLKTDTTWMVFSNMTVSAFAVYAIDLCWEYALLKIVSMPRISYFSIVFLFYALTNLTAYLWFIFAETLQASPLVDTQNKRMLFALPLLLSIVLALFSYETEWLFYVDSAGDFHRGKLFFLQLFLIFGYLIFASFAALLRGIKRKNYVNRGKFLTLGIFSTFPVIFGFLQVLLPGMPVFTAGVTLGILFVFFFFQEQLISTDPLTHLNNRNVMLSYLEQIMSVRNREKKIYLFMLDIDNFKSINDSYGHIQGDSALEQSALMLKKIASKNNCFLARFGGDEFIIIGELTTEDDARKVYNDIVDTTRNYNEALNSTYAITFSIGYAELTPDIKYIPDFIAKADQALYQAKRDRASAHIKN